MGKYVHAVRVPQAQTEQDPWLSVVFLKLGLVFVLP